MVKIGELEVNLLMIKGGHIGFKYCEDVVVSLDRDLNTFCFYGQKSPLSKTNKMYDSKVSLLVLISNCVSLASMVGSFT